ncbi:uncharacterized protein LOC127289807 [Leptopilina boulardi]|uniref:uncharacterized protein LOC127289807 n=1 Tax=Leptopilina boulardi TaxID=63433 RepID=UPI0021F584AE|nr:uncharacterized protein LOC127289807 [Leptopilina boulardi]
MKIQIFAISLLFAGAKSLIIPNYETEPETALGPVQFPPVLSRPENTNPANTVNSIKENLQFQKEENIFKNGFLIIDETHGFKYIVNPLNNFKIIIRRKPLTGKPFSFTPLRLLLGRFGYYENSPVHFF